MSSEKVLLGEEDRHIGDSASSEWPWGQRNCPLESNSMVTRWVDLKQEIHVFSTFLFALKGIITRPNELKNIKTNAWRQKTYQVDHVFYHLWPSGAHLQHSYVTWAPTKGLFLVPQKTGSYERPCAPPNPADRQLYDIASISSLHAFNLTYNALYESWKWAWAGNQRDAAWKQREFTGGDGAGVASDGTGSSHTAFVPRV